MAIELSRKQERLVVFLLTMIQVCHVLDFVIMMPLGATLIRSLNISSTEFGILVSAYTVSAGICGILGTFITNRFERKTFMLVLFIGFISGTFYCSMATSYHTLMLARIVAGGFGGILGSTTLTMVADYIPVHRRGTALGIVMTAFPISSVVGVPIGLMIANKFGWQSPFLFLVFLSLLFFVFALISLPKVNNKINLHFEPFAIVKSIFLNPTHLNAFFLQQTFMFAVFIVIPYIAPFMVKTVGLTEEQLPFIYFFGGALTFVTSQLIGRLTDRFGAKKIFLIISITSIIPTILLTNLEIRPLYQVIIITSLFMSFASGRNVPSMSLTLSKVTSHIRGSFMTFALSFQQLSVGLASYIGGALLREDKSGAIINYHELGHITIFFTIVGILIGYRLSMRPTQEE